MNMCIPKDHKSDYIYMLNTSPEYKSWLKSRFETVDELFLKLMEVELKKYQESRRISKEYNKVEEYLDDTNKDIKIYELLSNVSKDKTMKQKFIDSLKRVQEYDKKGYAYDERLLRRYSYTYYKELDLREEIIKKLEKASNGEEPEKYKLSLFDKCYQTFEYFEASAKILVKKDTSTLNEYDFSGISKEEFEEKLKLIKALSIMNDRYKKDISVAESEIDEIEKKIGFTLQDNAEIIDREIKYIKAALVDMMTLGEKLRHSFSVDGDFDVDFDL